MEKIWVTAAANSASPVRICPSERTAESVPVVLIVPGVGVPAAYYELYARGLAAAGIHAAIAELRGQGESRDPGGSYGYHTIASSDLPAAVAAVSNRFPRSPVFLLGHSVGGQLATLCAARGEARLRGLVLIASGTNYHRSYPRWFVPGLLMTANSPVLGATKLARTTVLGAFGRHSPTFRADWSRLVYSGRFTCADADVDYEEAVAAMRLPVLAICVREDRLAPRAAVEHLVAKMSAATVTRWQEPIAGHNGWIRDFRASVERIGEWIAETAGTPGEFDVLSPHSPRKDDR
ncbi:alpha/beta fold hydrolase [Nocardia lijiangensis]|uniref:alpha/beta fold hydrolase n=1 Tax=Nocardia lijiangensis TaxID=299618 RepID=UPI003D7407AA